MSSRKQMYNKEFHHLSEDEMQVLINSAKDGDDKSYDRLFIIFDNYLSKYFSLLRYGRIPFEDYDVRRFVALFMTNAKDRQRFLRKALGNGTREAVIKEFNGIVFMTNRYDDEDIMQTIRSSFVQCIERYERSESKAGGYVPFSGYLYTYYFYLLKKNVEIYLIDQLGRRTFALADDEEDREEGEIVYGYSAPVGPTLEDEMYTKMIDEHWVSGETAEWPFDQLSIQERQMLKWRFIDGERSIDISRRTSEHANTARDAFGRIKKKLMEIVADEGRY